MRARDTIANYWLGEGGECLEDAYPRHRQVAYDRADEIIAALRAAGYVIVPREATTPMLCAADEARDSARNPLTDAEVYSAMISAAKEQT